MQQIMAKNNEKTEKTVLKIEIFLANFSMFLLAKLIGTQLT